VVDTFDALADPTRRRIIELLARRGDLTAGDLANEFDSARPTISRHLRVLREAGVVRTRAVAQERYYMLEAAALQKIETWIARQRQRWALRLRALEEYLEDD
jgi:DNA-binding transcriptional ArsR family regulator